MNSLRTLLIGCAIAWPFFSAHAQDLVKFPTGTAAWTVDIAQSSGQPAESGTGGSPFQMKKIDITKVNGVSRYVITWANGTTTERWGYDQFQFIILTETYNGAPTFISGDDLKLGSPFAVGFDAPSFSWLQPDLLTDTADYGGKKCLHYQGTVVIERMVTVVNGLKKKVYTPLHCEAWIDKDTLLPVAFYDGSKLGVFTFLNPPTVPLVPPPIVKAALDHYIAASQPLR